MKRYLLGLLILVAFLLAGCSQSGSEAGQGSQVVGEGPDIIVDSGESRYVRFDQEEYDQAVEDGKVILLDFYANWCPICRNENPHIIQGLAEINSPDVIGYQVHILDDETSDEGKELAKKFGVTLQHTKVIVKNGELFSKSLEAWDKEKTINKINEALL